MILINILFKQTMDFQIDSSIVTFPQSNQQAQSWKEVGDTNLTRNCAKEPAKHKHGEHI